MTIGALQSQIKNDARLRVTRAQYREAASDVFGRLRILRSTDLPVVFATAPGIKTLNSELDVVGEPPDGFGKGINWSEDDDKLAAVVFLNTADPLGVMITGVRQFDTIEFVSATGLASSSRGDNDLTSSIIGVVAAGAGVAASAFGLPEVQPLIAAGETFAQAAFKQSEFNRAVRDPFGEIVSTGEKARQEVGVIVSLPEARTIFYGGDDDHKNRWIKKPGTRDLAHRPDHVKGAFFLQKGASNRHQAGAAGDIFLAAWDHIFPDNNGFYRLHILLRRGKPPIVT